MNNKLLIEGSLEVRIKRIQQIETYYGLLEGLPTTKMNARIQEEVKQKAQKDFWFDTIYLVEPIQTPIAYDGKYPFGEPSILPAITCIAELYYSGVFRDKSKDFSTLGIIWFQDNFAFPIDDLVKERILEIPFSKICGEFEY